MRKFNVLLKHKGKFVEYRDLTGKKAVELMRFLNGNKHLSVAYTKSHGITETLTLKEMEDVVL